MGESGMRALRAELGGAAPEGLDVLDDDELEVLAGALRDARERQTAALDEATQEALGFVPRLLRGAVRRSLFG